MRSRGAYTSFGYQAAIVAVRDGRPPLAGSGDRHALLDRGRLLLQSRDFVRNNGIYKGMLDRAVAYIVGNGFGLQAKTDSQRWNQQVEKLWRGYWLRPEITQLLSGRRVERLVAKELLTCGDTGAIKTDRGLLQLVEAEQIIGPTLLGTGIQVDDYGAPQKYMIAPYGKAGAPLIAQRKEYKPEDFLFVGDRERPTSTRGVPPCQASFPMLHRINDVCDSEAIAWQMLARMAISINRKDSALLASGISTPDTSVAQGQEGDLTTRLTELDYALIFHGEPGEEVKGIERNIPGQNFSESLMMFLRLLGLPLGLPLEVILLDWTKSNYSQSRAVLEQAYVTFLGWQFLLEDFFHQPTYAWFVDRMIEEGQLRERDDRYEHDWIKPTFPWIDQLKEAEAQGLKLDRGFTTHASVLKGLGLDREEVLVARDREIREAIDIAKKIEADTGIDVPWQIFAGLAAPGAPPPPKLQEAGKPKDNKDNGGKE